MTLDPALLELLCCPSQRNGAPCHGSLEDQGAWLVCTQCERRYPVEDGIPVLLPQPEE